jgi:hypothetical protein
MLPRSLFRSSGFPVGRSICCSDINDEAGIWPPRVPRRRHAHPGEVV